MNTQQLHCFLCVADKLNFTRAAEELWLSTPTVTHHIQSLEAELDTKLFIRTKRSVRITEAGMVFYNDANDILDRFDLAKKHAEKMKQKHFSILRIGCSSHGELERLIPILEKFRDICPDVHPDIRIATYSQILGMLSDKQLDVIFGTKEMMKNLSAYTFKAIAKLKNYAVVSDNNPLSTKSEVSFDDLETCCCIVLHPKLIPYRYGNRTQEKIQKRSQTQRDIMCENDQAGLAMAAAGYGVSILPEFCIPRKIDTYGLVKIPLKENEDIEYGISYPSKEKGASVKEFIRLCTG